jgi:5'-nucleotidase
VAFDYFSSATRGARIKNLTLNGLPIEKTRNYQVTVGDFLAAGGDSFTAFKKGLKPLGGGTDLDVLSSYMKINHPLSPPSLDRIRMQ